MNLSNADTMRSVSELSANHRKRFTATLISYNHTQQTAIVGPMVNAPSSMWSPPTPVSRSLEIAESSLVPGAIVVLERLTNRQTVIVDVVNRPYRDETMAIPGDHVTVPGGVTSDLLCTANSPVNGSVSWSAGELSYEQQRFTVSSGNTSSRYVYWFPGTEFLTPSDAPPSSGGTQMLIIINRDGYPTCVTNAVDGYAIISGSINGAIHIAPQSITGNAIANNEIHGYHLLAGTVGWYEIADNAIITSKIAANAVTSGKMATDSILTVSIKDGAVTEPKIADNAVTSGKIADGSILNAKIADNAVTSGKIADGSILNAKIADNAVTSGKIAAANILNSHIVASAGISVSKIESAPTYRTVYVNAYDDAGGSNPHVATLVYLGTT